MPPADLKDMFREPEHQPFVWERGSCAALLVHGYTGTPGEVRPLGWSLRQAGWTVSGILLPGMGNQIESLRDHGFEDWVDAATTALRDLKARYSPVLLVGFSMGGAIVQHAAAAHPPDGLVLMAPASEFGGPIWRATWPLLIRVMPHMRPFARANFGDPRVQKAAERLTPDGSLSALEGQERVRRLSIPTRAFTEVWRLLRATRRLTLPKAMPTLVVQGTADPYVRPAHTRRLLGRLPAPLRYREVAATHTLMGPRCPSWPEVERAVIEFAEEIRARALKSGDAGDGAAPSKEQL